MTGMTATEKGQLGAKNAQKNYILGRIKGNLNISPPAVTWKELMLDLSSIKDKFIIPDFDRLVNTNHVNRIVFSICNNEFYDNIIRVVKKDDKYLVIDGQHRLSALWKVYSLFNFARYPIILGIYKEDKAIRLIYRKINSGLPLKLVDYLKSLDDKKTYKFFNILRDVCDHNRQLASVGFLDALNAIHYAKVESDSLTFRSASINTVLERLRDTTDFESSMMKEFIVRLYEIFPEKNVVVYNATIFRNVYRIAVVYKMSVSELRKLCNVIINDETMSSDLISKEDIRRFYDKLVRTLNKWREQN